MTGAAGPVTVGPDGTHWRRVGYCSGCGECCLGDPFNGERGEAVVEGYCPLARAADGAIRCSGYGRDRYYLSGCNVFPQFPSQIADKPSCTYSFERAE